MLSMPQPGGTELYGQQNNPERTEYYWEDNGNAGVNYFKYLQSPTFTGKPTAITNSEFGAGSGQDYSSIENWVKQQYDARNAQQAAPGGTTTTTTTPGASYDSSRINTLLSGFNTQKSNVYNTANDAARNSGISIKDSILDLVESLRQGQQQIDTRGINNEVNKIQGGRSIMDMVGRGIKSGGVMLNNKNAGDSSAAGEIGRAYGTLGRGEMSKIGNQYEMENIGIGEAQANLGIQTETGKRKITDSKTQTINNIVTAARNEFARIDAAMVNADLPGRIALEQEKEQVRGQVMGILSEYDGMLASETGSIKAMDPNARRSEGMRRASAGVAPENAFKFDELGGGTFQNQGANVGSPLFTLNRRRTV